MIIASDPTPPWVSLIIAASALLTAVAIVWRLLVKPMFRLIKTGEQVIPLMNNLIDAMSETKTPFSVLDDIIAQFRTNSGSSLKDAINRLEAAITDLHSMGQSAKSMADADRARVAAMSVQLEDLNAWRRVRQSDEVVEAAAARLVADRQVALDAAAALVLSNQGASDIAAAKVLRDNDPVSGLPGVAGQPSPTEGETT